MSNLFPQGHKYNSRPELAHSIIGRIKQLPIRCIPKRCEFITNVIAVITKHCIKNAPHILDHHCTWHGLFDDPDSSWKQITFIVRAQLLSGLREWRARQSTANEIYAFVGCGIENVQVRPDHIPGRTVVN